MKEELFEKYSTDYKRWISKSRQHLFMVEVLTDTAHKAMLDFASDKYGAAAQSPEFLVKAKKVQATGNARALFMALAIENATKAKQFFLGNILYEDETLKGLRKDHNIIEHVKQCNIILDTN